MIGRRTTLDPGTAARCAFRTVLEHDGRTAEGQREVLDDTAQRRISAAGSHRDVVRAALLDLHGARAADACHDTERTARMLADPALEVIVNPRLPRDEQGRRHGSPTLLVAASRDGLGWRPVDVHNHFLTADGTSEFLSSSIAAPMLADAVVRGDRRLRKGGAWRRDLLRLAHHHRVLESLGVASTHPEAGGVIDRSSALWWVDLNESLDDRGSALVQYDARFAERVALLEATEARNADPSLVRVGAPWWHRECDDCPHSLTCHAELEAADDVSLVRFTDATEQELLRDHGVATRRQLAALDLADIARGRATDDEPSDASTPTAIAIGRRVKDAERLVLRARVEVAGTILRLVDADRLDARRCDVEIDIDMESYDNATYMWGTYVTARVPTGGIEEGYRAFVQWDELSDLAEGALFAAFFDWLSGTVATARAAGRTVGIYCFWEHAERTQMRRAMDTGAAGLPSQEQLDEVLGASLVDLHTVVTTQMQTAGPAGLKVVAGAAGFSWRDEDPSGEASMGWYEVATGDDAAAARTAKERLLAYNEDDCRATRALRDWLEGPARALPDVEEARPHVS